MATNQQLLVMMLGVPGSGKSYFARNLAEQLGMKRITADEVRTRLFGSINAGRTPENHRHTYKTVNQEMHAALKQGDSVVRDNQNNSRADRDYCRQVADEVGARAVIVWIVTPKDVAIQRCVDREATSHQLRLDKVTAEQFYERSMAALEPPLPEELCIKIDGTLPFADQLAIFEQQAR